MKITRTVITFVAVGVLAVASVASAHESRTYVVDGVQYAFVVGSLGEPVIVDDKTGLDLSITRNGKPYTAATSTLKVEVASGSTTKEYALESVWGQPGKFKTTFIVTSSAPLSYRIFGTLGNRPVSFLFTCSAAGHVMNAGAPHAMNEAVSEGVAWTLHTGSFGCPAPKSEYQFPVTAPDSVDASNTLNKLTTSNTVAIGIGLIGVLTSLGSIVLQRRRSR